MTRPRHATRALALALALACAQPAWAVSDPREQLADPAQEARAVAIGQQLRCLVCQNESIEDSNADLARDLRGVVREHVARGESEATIMAWMQARYGSFVRLRPPFDWGTAVLWLTPLAALLLGGLMAWRASRTPPPPPAPLSATETEDLARLLGPSAGPERTG